MKTKFLLLLLIFSTFSDCTNNDNVDIKKEAIVQLQFPEINQCINSYVTCTEVTPNDDCSTCLQYCGAQEYWSTELCPLAIVPEPE